MLIRFRQTTPSANPDFPFQAGQIIATPSLNPEMRRWIRDGFVEVIHEESEAATVVAPEHAVMAGARRRRA